MFDLLARLVQRFSPGDPPAGGGEGSAWRALPPILPEAEEMVRRQIVARGIDAPKLVDAMRRLDRRLFAPRRHAHHAFEERPLGIGLGQTISQPYIVAAMTKLLEVEPGQRILEIGTGSGYQAAVLAMLGARVTSVERHAALSRRAAEALRRAGAPPGSVRLIVADGSAGWPAGAPYDRIIATAAAADGVSPALVEQLAEGGILVAPEGPPQKEATQWLRRWRKLAGRAEPEDIFEVRFVPLVPGLPVWPRLG